MTKIVGITEREERLYWEPKEDITMYELAMALGVLLPATGGTIHQEKLIETVHAMPASIRRHFRLEMTFPE